MWNKDVLITTKFVKLKLKSKVNFLGKLKLNKNKKVLSETE